MLSFTLETAPQAQAETSLAKIQQACKLTLYTAMQEQAIKAHSIKAGELYINQLVFRLTLFRNFGVVSGVMPGALYLSKGDRSCGEVVDESTY